MNIFDPLISGSLSVSGSGEISGDLRVLGEISGTISNATSASHAAEYLLTSSFGAFTSSYTTGSFTGSFGGDGSNLTNIPASGVTGLNLTQIADGSVTASVSNANGLRVNSNTEITGALTITGSITLNGVPVGTGKLDEVVFNTYSSSNDTTNSLQNSRLDNLESSTSSLNTFTSSATGRLNTIESTTGSLNTFTSSAIDKLTSLELTTSSLNTFTSSANGRLNSLETASSSIITDLNSYTSSNNTVIGTIQTATSSLNGFTSSANGRLNSLETASGSIITDFNTYTSSNNTTNETQNNRLNSIESTTSSLNSYTSSNNTRLGIIETTTGSLNSYTTSNDTNISAIHIATSSLNSYTSSTNTKLISIESSTSSLNTFTSSASGRLTSLENVTGSYATTGSNIFIGNQTITGSLFISQDLIVQGSSSLENITASAVSIGTNTIVLNTNSPAFRYAGISVFDSGSTNITASLFYDSLTNQWKFKHTDVGTNDASIMLFGPLGSDIDNAPLLDGNFLTKVENNGHGHHITTSSIFDNGSKVSINSNSEITGSLTVTGVVRSTTTPLVSGSSQIDHNATTNYVANRHIDHTSVLITTLAGSGLTGGGDITTTRDLSIATGGVTNAMLAGSIENGKLTNSSLTIGSTAISLGGSSATLGGLTSVTSTAFTGSLQGSISGNAATVTTNANLTGVVTSTGNATTIANGNITNAMLGGSIANDKLVNSSFHIGTTSISLGRGSAVQSLTGVSIDGNAGTVTNGVYTTGDQSIAGTKTFTGTISVTASEGREITTFMPASYTTGDLVSGHEYGWYADHWRLGMTRSGAAAGEDFVIQWNGARRLSLTNGGNLTVTGTIGATNLSGTNTGDQTTITGNAGSATILQTARNIGGVSFNGSANIDLPGVNTAGNQNTTGNAATATEVIRTVAAANEANLLYATIADNDYFRIRVGGGSNAGFVEIATADDGTEPIHVRQYTGVFSSLTRTATLLDGNGNTSFPGIVTAPTFSGNATSVTNGVYTTGDQSIGGVKTFTGTLQGRKNQTANDYTTAPIWTESHGNTGTGIAFHINGNVGKYLEMRTNGILYWENNTVWTSGTLTNLNQLSNGPGYVTGGPYLPLAGGTMTGNITITSADIRSNASSGWTGDPGAQGKIQYHSNRWYIVSDQSSDRVVQFRRNGTDVSHIANDGTFHGSITGNAATATSAGNSSTVGGFAASDFIRKGENVDTALGDNTDNRAAVLTLNNTHTDTFTANADIGDGRRVLTIQNPTSNTGNGRFTAMQFQIVGDTAGNRTMGDLKFVRDSGSRGRWYFTSRDASNNWNDSLSISSHGTTVNSRGNAGGTVFSVQGTSGQLFSVTDSLTGTIFAASDISGIPILEVNSNGTVTVDNTLNVFGDVTAFFSSDERLKDNVTPISNAIEKIKSIGGYEFDWNGLSKNVGHDVGVIAQEVEKVLPEIVTTRDNGFKAVKYDRLTALLIQANKELIERVEYLESKLK